MRRSLLLFIVLALALSSCAPAYIQELLNPTPLPNLEATAAVLLETLAAQTQSALPSSVPTLVPSNTPSIVASPTAVVAPTINLTATSTAVTPVVSGTLVATILPGTMASPTPTLYARFFGTRPPLVPSGRLILRNRSHAEAYVSFQCINQEKTLSILEYPVSKWMEVKIPSGKCDYVAWVGGRQFLGKFSLDTGGQKMIIFFMDRILIK